MGDQQFNAAQLAGTGAGVVGDVESCAARLASLLTDSACALAAADLARENASRPSPAQIAADLPSLL